MPLVPSVLSDGLRKFLDKDFAGFVAFPENEADATTLWGAAVDDYTGNGLGIIPPTSVPGAGDLAKAALVGGLFGMAGNPAAMVLFDAAFLAYVAAIITGQAPAFVSTPPPVPLSVTLLPSAVANLMAAAPPSVQLPILAATIDAWFRTAIATPAAGPPSAPWA